MHALDTGSHTHSEMRSYCSCKAWDVRTLQELTYFPRNGKIIHPPRPFSNNAGMVTWHGWQLMQSCWTVNLMCQRVMTPAQWFWFCKRTLNVEVYQYIFSVKTTVTGDRRAVHEDTISNQFMIHTRQCHRLQRFFLQISRNQGTRLDFKSCIS